MQSDVYDKLTDGKLTEIFQDIFMRDDLTLTPELTAKEVPGWDSFKQIEIIIAIEEAYQIRFRTKDLDSLHNVGDLARTILEKNAA
jgi:acyl carrier protein